MEEKAVSPNGLFPPQNENSRTGGHAPLPARRHKSKYYEMLRLSKRQQG